MTPPPPRSAPSPSALAMVAELMVALAGAGSLDDLARALADGAPWVLPADLCVVAVLADAAPGWSLHPGGAALEDPGGALGVALARGATVRLDDASRDDLRALGDPLVGATEALRSLLVVPLREGRDVSGAILFGARVAGAYARVEPGLPSLIALHVAAVARGVRLLARERAARDAAERATVTRDALLASVSHDLRGPLTNLQLLLDWHRAAKAHGLPSPIREDLSELSDSVRQMTAMVGELLDVAVLQAGKRISFHFASAELSEVIHEALAAGRRQCRDGQLELDVAPDGLRGEFDRPRLVRVFMNLVGNAIKYSPGGGRIRVRAWRDAADGHAWAAAEVKDSGIGIPATDLPKLGARFQRAGNVREIPGTGLGLATAREIVAGHGGTLEVASVEGEGTTVTVRLPLG